MSSYYDSDTDYSVLLNQMMAAGASAAEVESTLQQRVTKATSDENLMQYAYDDTYTAAKEYINSMSNYSQDSTEYSQNTATAWDDYSGYASLLQSSVDALMSQESFSYDPSTDAVYASYADMYQREGDRASENAMGDAAIMAGGQISTAAMTAASQAQDYYTSQLNDVLPQLYAMAYDMYTAESNSLRSDVELLADLTSQAYAVADNETDRDWSIYQSNASVSDDLYSATLEQQESANSADGDTSSDFYDRAMAFLNQGVMPSDAMLSAAGLDADTAEAYRQAALRKLNT